MSRSAHACIYWVVAVLKLRRLMLVPNFCLQTDHQRRQKQLAKAKAWEAEFARKCQPLKPVQIGCVWSQPGPLAGGGQLSKEQAFLQQFAAMALVELPIRIATKLQSPPHSETHGRLSTVH